MNVKTSSYPLVLTKDNSQNLFSSFDLSSIANIFPKNVTLDKWDNVRSHQHLDYDCFTTIPVVLSKLIDLFKSNDYKLTIKDGFLIIVDNESHNQSIQNLQQYQPFFSNNIGHIVFNHSASVGNPVVVDNVALVFALHALRKEFITAIQQVVCGIKNIHHGNDKEYLDSVLEIGSIIQVPVISEDMDEVVFDDYKIIGKNYFCNKTQNAKLFDDVTCKNISKNSKKKIRFYIHEQPFGFIV